MTESRKTKIQQTDVTIVDRLEALPLSCLEFHGNSIGFQALLAALLLVKGDRPWIWVPPDGVDLTDLRDETRFWNEVFADFHGRVPSPVVTLPEYDRNPFLLLETHPAIVQSRIESWSILSGSSHWLLLAPIETLLRRIPPRDYFRTLRFDVRPGLELPRDILEEIFREYGYRKSDMVQQPGDYSLRGAILDFHPPGYPHPVRIEFLDEVVEEIRIFDPMTQRSEETLSQISLLPWLEFPITEKERDLFLEKASAVIPPEKWPEDWNEALEKWAHNHQFPGYEDYLPWFLEDLQGWTEAYPEVMWILGDADRFIPRWDFAYKQVLNSREDAVSRGNPAPFPASLVHLEGGKKIYETAPIRWRCLDFPQSERREAYLHVGSPPSYEGDLHRFVRETLIRLHDGQHVWVVASSRARAERLCDLFRDQAQQGGPIVPPKEVLRGEAREPLLFTWGDCRLGFDLTDPALLLIGEDHLFGRRAAVPRAHEVALDRMEAVDLSRFQPGDYVVHREHGIGRYLGLKRLYYGEHSVEAVSLQYSGGDILYVPVDRIENLRKYTSLGDKEPSLDHLGGRTWKVKKQRARKAVESVVQPLVDLYAKRRVQEGYAFPPDDELQAGFEQDFEYELTPDQRRAVREIKQDMENTMPMDRLLCGDVGFGKTEVAMRAAFKAVRAGKQVAVLAPTTVLVLQHLQTFRQRFSEFPIRVAMLSRLVPPSKQKEIFQRLKKGEIDIIIGTHRLLSKETEFYDLGLLIIDEEQRFGVLQKERLKQMRANVDVLSMTATPIPRTLQMAFSGFMNLSTIRTPPRDRMAVQTYVMHFAPEIIISAVEHELARGGQVYIVHNEVETLDRFASQVQKWLPMACITVAHGQMHPRPLEDVMLKFVQGEYDVLISTTIIENGLDIPNVNTLIVNQAHRFGLSQLYQLRGRVGRSSRRAYAYLLVPPATELTDTARKRLAALKEFTELGSGFRLAGLDLELRGAGELLGKRQHGHITALGFDEYLEIIHEAIARYQNQRYEPPFSPTLQLPIVAEIPDDYMPAEQHRIYYYRRLAELEDRDAAKEIRNEMRDLYGPLPTPVENLIEISMLKAVARSRDVASIMLKGRTLVLQLQPRTETTRTAWVAAIQRNPNARLVPPDTLHLPLAKDDPNPLEILELLTHMVP